MFGNKAYAWKLGAALALLAGLGVIAARRGQGINPPLWICVSQPEAWDGEILWIPIAKILSTTESDFMIAAGDSQIRVEGKAPAAVNDHITLRGVFLADGPRMTMMRWRVFSPDISRRRLLMEIVSIAVVLAVIANFLRHFVFRPTVLHVKGKDD